MLKHLELGDGSASADVFSQYFDPEGHRVIHMAGRQRVRLKDLEDQPNFQSQIDNILAFVGDRRLVSLRASFDSAFLQEEFLRAKRDFTFSFVDLMKVVAEAEPALKGKSLDQLCKGAGIQKGSQHDTEDDMVSAYRLFINFNIHTNL
jgi:DNA polymerase III epsilon subunit-like protein